MNNFYDDSDLDDATTAHIIFIEQLEAVAKFYKEHTGNRALPCPSNWDWKFFLKDYFSRYVEGSEERNKRYAKQIVRSFPHVDKVFDGESMTLEVPLAISREKHLACLKFTYEMPRKTVCRQVDTGETITKKISKVIVPAVVEEVEETVPVLAWDCGSILKEDREEQ